MSIELLGPLAVALAGSRRWLDAGWALLATAIRRDVRDESPGSRKRSDRGADHTTPRHARGRPIPVAGDVMDSECLFPQECLAALAPRSGDCREGSASLRHPLRRGVVDLSALTATWGR